MENRMANVKPVPEGHHTITPALIVSGGKKAIEFYKAAFGAVERGIMLGPNGSVMHAELMIGNSLVFVSDESPDMGARSPQSLGGSPVSFNIYTEDCDALFQRAVAAGGTVTMPLADMFWGDRYGTLTDPFGHKWGIATHKEDLTLEEVEKRGKEAMAAMGDKR
jgi:PhnB protein